MAKYQHFEDLPVWQEAAKLYSRVQDLMEQTGAALSASFRNQLDRASLSVANNIAAGFEQDTRPERVSYLTIARDSATDIRSMLAVVKDRPKLKGLARDLQEVCALAESCSRQLMAWMAAVEKPASQGERRSPLPEQQPRNTQAQTSRR